MKMKPCMHFSVVENNGDATLIHAAAIKYCMIQSTRKCEMCCFSHWNAFYKVARGMWANAKFELQQKQQY